MDADLYQVQRAEDNGVIEFETARVMFSLGLAGETGEVVDYMKKVIGHGRELDRKHLVAELGDVIWYVSQLAHIHGITMSEIMQANTDKLRERYPHGFYGDLPHWKTRLEEAATKSDDTPWWGNPYGSRTLKAKVDQLRAGCQLLQVRVKELEQSLQGFIDLANESQGVMGWHLNGDVLPWEDVDQLRVAKDLLTPKGTA